MNPSRPLFDSMTTAPVPHTITLPSAHTQVTGLLIGIDVDLWPPRTPPCTVSVYYVSVSARFDHDVDDWDVPVTSGMTLEVHP